jgi:hypothetical protein
LKAWPGIVLDDRCLKVDSFYEHPLLGLFKANYWFYLFNSLDGGPDISMTCALSKTKLRINNKEIKGKQLSENKYQLFICCWKHLNGKTEFIHNGPGTVTLHGKKNVFEGKDFKAVITGTLNYNLKIYKKGKQIGSFTGAGSKPAIRRKNHHRSEVEKCFFSKDYRTLSTLVETTKYIAAARHCNCFIPSGGKFADKPVKGIAWVQNLIGFAAVSPWKLLSITMPDFSRLYFTQRYDKRYWFYKEPEMFFDHAGDKRYNFNSMKYVYLDNKRKECKDPAKAKFVRLNGSAKNIKLSLTAKLKANQPTTFEKFGLKYRWYQLIGEMQEFSLKINNREIKQKDWKKSVVYGEHAKPVIR